MTRAYDKVYLSRARSSLARMLDFACNDLGFDITIFFNLFIDSGVAESFGEGDSHLIAGMSGVELAYEVLDCSGTAYTRIKPHYTCERSREYWVGWALAYYQWRSVLSFAQIVERVPITDIRDMYNPYHEMDVRQFCDAMDAMISN